MRYPYSLAQLQPFNIRVIEGTTHAVYNLPAPVQWCIKQYVGEDYWREDQHTISQIRIFLTTDEFTNEPYAGAVPYDEQGREHPISCVRYPGACSVVAVLSRMGFEPILPVN